jgi:hypothetical protein
VITLGVRGRNPTQHPTHQAILGRTKNHVPMIRQERKRKQFHGIALESFGQHAEERLIILGFAKDCLPRIATIEGMVNQTAFISTLLSGHDQLSSSEK